MLRRSLLVVSVLAIAICFSCGDDNCDRCDSGLPLNPPAEPVTTVWQAVAGVETPTGPCDRPADFQGGLVLPDPIEVVDNRDGTYQLTLPNGCSDPCSVLAAK